MNKEQKILVLDLETSPWRALMYGNIYEPVFVKMEDYTQILSIAWRWYGEDKTYYKGQNSFKKYKSGKINDKELVKFISELVNQATYIVAHNGIDFDKRMIQERILYHRLPPISEAIWLDTKKIFRQVAKLPSNKLDHVSDFMGNGHKLPHKGMELFLGCMNGNKEDWKTNELYNKQDVDILYKDFEDVMPYTKLPSSYIKQQGEMMNCPNPTCGGSMHKEKKRLTICGYKQQWQCGKCGRYHTPNKIVQELTK